MALPPWELARDVLLMALLLPFNVAAACLYAATRVSPGRGVLVGGVAGIILAFMAANDFRSVSDYRMELGKRLTVHDLAVAGYDTAMGNGPAVPPPLYWLPWSSLLAGAAALLTRMPGLPKLVGAFLAMLAACVIARWIVPPGFRAAHDWGWPLMAGAVLVLWASLEAAAKSRPGGAVPFALAGAFLAAAAVILHTHSARLSDIAIIAAGTWLGIAAVAWQRNLEVGVLTPFAAAMLPALVFIAEQSRDDLNRVPLTAFLLVALSPAVFAPALVASMLGKSSSRLVIMGVVLMAAACGVAVVLAARAETLAFDM